VRPGRSKEHPIDRASTRKPWRNLTTHTLTLCGTPNSGREEGWLGPVIFLNRDLVGAQYSDVERAFTDAAVWFREEGGATGFDGGGIHFTFSGHGREDGVLILENDTLFSPRDLVTMALAAHEASGSSRQTKFLYILTPAIRERSYST